MDHGNGPSLTTSLRTSTIGSTRCTRKRKVFSSVQNADRPLAPLTRKSALIYERKGSGENPVRTEDNGFLGEKTPAPANPSHSGKGRVRKTHKSSPAPANV